MSSFFVELLFVKHKYKFIKITRVPLRDAQFKFGLGDLVFGGGGKIASQILNIGGQDFENPNISSA